MRRPEELRYLRSLDVGVLRRALEASGLLGPRAPGALVIKRELGTSLGWIDEAYIQAVRDLQDLADWAVQPRGHGGWDAYVACRTVQNMLALGCRAYEAQGLTGPCPCVLCMVRQVWLGELWDALSEW